MASNKALINDLTEGPINRQILTFSTPIILANLLQVIYNMVDMVIVGQFCGSAGLSAVSISSQVFTIMTVFCIGFATSGQIYISQLVGARRTEGLRAAIGTLFTFTLLIGIFMTVIGFTLCNPVLRLLNTPDEAFAQARAYTLICSGGMIFAYGYNVVAAILRGMGDSRHPLMFIGLAAGLNLVLDLIFVGPMGLGVAGAAWATIIGQTISLLLSLVYLYRRRVQFGFDFKRSSFRISGKVLKIYIKLGLPFAIKSCAINISMIAVTGMVNAYGIVPSAAFGVGMKVQTITIQIMLSVASAISTMTGQNIGAGKFDRARKCVWAGIGFGWILYAVFAVIFLICPVFVFRIFTPDEAVLALAPLFLHTLIISFPAMATLEPINGLVQASGASVYFLVLALTDAIFFRIGLSYLFGTVLQMGIAGFFLGFSLAPYSTMIPNLIFFLSNRWQKRRLIHHEEA